MAVTNGYCTVAELRTQFSDPTSQLTLETLERAINATSRAIDKLTGRRFWLDGTAAARVYRPRNTGGVWVDDIGSETGLIVKTDTTGDGTFATTWDASDYQLEPLNADKDDAAYAWTRLVAVDDKTFITGRDDTRPRRATLQVTATFGWSAVPDLINQAAVLKACKLFKRKDSPEGFASGFGDFGPVRISKFEDPDVWSLLQGFIRIATPES